MDLLFKRYASPFSFMDGMIQTNRFDDFVYNFINTTNKEKEDKINWEFYLHKVWEGSFSDFKTELDVSRENQEMSERAIETTVQHSQNILNMFNPDEQGG